MTELRTIGWSELVDFPEWGVTGIRAKVDTGARTSALHVEDITELPDGRVAFDVTQRSGGTRRRVRVEALVTRRAGVRSSSGHYARRPFIEAEIALGGERHTIELSLVARDRMTHRMLLGRSALTGRYLVDVSRRTVLRNGPVRVRSKKRAAGAAKVSTPLPAGEGR